MTLELHILNQMRNIQFSRSSFVDLQQIFPVQELDEIRDLIREDDYFYFVSAVLTGNIDMVKAMLSIFSFEEQRRMNTAYHYGAFRQAKTTVWGNGQIVSDFLLSNFPEDAAAMIHANEEANYYQAIGVSFSYHDICNGEINLQDLNLIGRQGANLENLERLFRSLTVEKRQSFIELGDFLAVRLAIQAGSIYQFERLCHYSSNEQREAIARLPGASAILNEISTYYNSPISLQVNNLNHSESSMRQLTPEEKNRLANILNHYKPVIDKNGGVEQTFQMLVRSLQQRYLFNKATLKTGDGRTIELPLTWEEWEQQAVSFNFETKENALKAYYKDKIHTALRYFSIPNRWINESSEHSMGEGQLRYANFDEFKEIIVSFWLAAHDNDMPSSDDSSTPDRINWFFNEINEIARAHNRDEGFDDEKADNPSCSLGVLTRLIQSVRAHPLMADVLSKILLKMEFDQFMLQHFKNHIPIEKINNLELIFKLYLNGCEADISNEDMALVMQLNVTVEEQQDFLQSLQEKYNLQWDEAATSYIQGLFNLTKLQPNHVFKNLMIFYTALKQSFVSNNIPEQNEEKVTAETLSIEELRAKRIRFFSPQMPTGDEIYSKDNYPSKDKKKF